MKKRKVRVLALAFLLAILTACSDGSLRESSVAVGSEREKQAAEPSVSVPEGSGFVVVRSSGGMRASLSRAISLRDMAVRERTGVTVRYAETADDAAALIAVEADLLSGEREFDAAEGSFSRLCGPLFVKGALRSAEELGGALGEASLNPSLKTEKGTFFITGATVPDSLGDVACIVADLDVARRYDVRVPDADALSGKDGWDALAASAAQIPEGAGIGRFGIPDRSVGAAILGSAGYRLTVGGKDKAPSVAPVAGEAAQMLGKVADLLKGATANVTVGSENCGDRAEGCALSDPGVLYLLCRTGDLPALRDAGCDILILPYPGGENSADSTGGTAWVILKGGGNRTAARTLRSLEDESLKFTFTETVDAYLAGRTYYDRDSRDTLLHILESPGYELSLALSCEDGEELNEMLSAAAEKGAGALFGWETKAALISEKTEKLFAVGP